MTVSGRYNMLQDEGIRRFMLETDALYPPDAVQFTIEQQRAFYDRLCAHFRRPRPEGIFVRDLSVPGHGGLVPVRLYCPRVASRPPVLLYLHGGGYVLGGLDSHDDICAELAERAEVAVVAVHYRLAPEHPFPAAFEDCRAARDWITAEGAQHGLRTQGLVLGGDSAGGNLAAALAIDARDRGWPQVAGQVLIYPGLGGDMSKGSYIQHAQAPGLTTEDVRYYHAVYAPSDLAQDSKFTHPLSETTYRGLAPAFLVAAEWDPLRDDCYAYCERLNSAGVTALVRHEPLLVHAFLRARHMSRPAAQSFTAVVEAVRSLAFGGRLPPHP